MCQFRVYIIPEFRDKIVLSVGTKQGQISMQLRKTVTIDAVRMQKGTLPDCKSKQRLFLWSKLHANLVGSIHCLVN